MFVQQAAKLAYITTNPMHDDNQIDWVPDKYYFQDDLTNRK